MRTVVRRILGTIYNNHNTRLTAFYPELLGEPVPER